MQRKSQWLLPTAVLLGVCLLQHGGGYAMQMNSNLGHLLPQKTALKKNKNQPTQQDVVKASLCNIFSPSGPEWVTSGKQKMGALKPFLKQGSRWLALGWKQEWSLVVSTSMWTGATLIPLSLNHTAGWDVCIFLVLAITYPNSQNEQLPTRWRAGHTAVAEALLDKEHISTWVLQLNWVHC